MSKVIMLLFVTLAFLGCSTPEENSRKSQGMTFKFEDCETKKSKELTGVPELGKYISIHLGIESNGEVCLVARTEKIYNIYNQQLTMTPFKKREHILFDITGVEAPQHLMLPMNGPAHYVFPITKLPSRSELVFQLSKPSKDRYLLLKSKNAVTLRCISQTYTRLSMEKPWSH